MKNTLEVGLITATEIHEYLTDAIRARMSDIRNDDHTFKPRSEWPEIWDRMEEAGDVEVSYESERSHDGETKDKPGGWDRTGRTVEKVKLKFASKTTLLEMAMNHIAVNAMVREKQGDINIVVVTAEKARQVASAKKRLSKVIEVTPTTISSVEVLNNGATIDNSNDINGENVT